MQKLEELKQELIKQKDIIKKKGGKITIANNNPSPSEITAGINSIISSDIDFSLANATNDDVKKGKTYYNNLGELQTGNYEDLAYTFFLYNVNEVDKNKQYEFVVPEYMKNMRDSLFFDFPCKLNVVMQPDATIIPKQALYSASGEITLQNYDELTKLVEVQDYALAGARGVDLTRWAPTLQKIGQYAFMDAYNGQTSLKLPTTVKTISEGCFSCSENKKATITNLDMTNWPLAYTSKKMFANLYINQDFAFPTSVTGLAERTFEGGGIKRITFPQKVNTISDKCFYNNDDVCYTEYLVFLGEKPPIPVGTIFNYNHALNLRVYVPDNSVSEYKAKFVDFKNILPMSQKP